MSGPVLEVEGASRAFGAVRAVEQVSFTVGDAEVVAVLGPSGCGKSTLLRLIAGIEPLDAGTIRLGGEVLSAPGRSRPPEQRAVGLVFQDYALFPHLSVLDNVLFGLRERAADGDPRGAALALLERVGLAAKAASFPHTLSGGEQQRVALVRSLAPRPRLLLLDEPFAGLDTVLRASVRGETLQLLAERGCPALVVTHDPEEAMEISDRLLVLRQGQVEQLAPPEAVYFQPETAFVARFIGHPNVLPAEVVSAGEVRCGPLRFHAGNARFVGRPVAGGRAEVVVRPEAVTLLATDPAGAAARESFQADLVAVSWLAGAVRIKLALEGGRELAALLPAWLWHRHAAEASRGPLQLTLETSGVHVFPAP